MTRACHIHRLQPTCRAPSFGRAKFERKGRLFRSKHGVAAISTLTCTCFGETRARVGGTHLLQLIYRALQADRARFGRGMRLFRSKLDVAATCAHICTCFGYVWEGGIQLLQPSCRVSKVGRAKLERLKPPKHPIRLDAQVERTRSSRAELFVALLNLF